MKIVVTRSSCAGEEIPLDQSLLTEGGVTCKNYH